MTTIVNRKTRGIFACAVLHQRTFDTLQPLVDQVFELVPRVQHFYSDGLAAYRELVYRQGRRVAQHHPMNDKSQTYTIEGTNADLRCYVPSLDRRGRCFPRRLDRFRSLIRLFLTCYNRCCLFRLLHPKHHAHPSDFLPALF